MLIFVEKVNERLTYTFDFIFKERDLNYVFTSNESEFERHSEVKFNYSRVNFSNAPTIAPSNIIFSHDLKNYTLTRSLFSLSLIHI